MKEIYLYNIGFETEHAYELIATTKQYSILEIAKLAEKAFPKETIISITRFHLQTCKVLSPTLF